MSAKREREESIATQVHDDSDSDETLVEEIRPAPALRVAGCTECVMRELMQHSESPTALVEWVEAHIRNPNLLYVWTRFCNAQRVSVLRCIYRAMFLRMNLEGPPDQPDPLPRQGWFEVLMVARIALVANATHQGAVIPWYAREREMLLQYT